MIVDRGRVISADVAHRPRRAGGVKLRRVRSSVGGHQRCGVWCCLAYLTDITRGDRDDVVGRPGVRRVNVAPDQNYLAGHLPHTHFIGPRFSSSKAAAWLCF